MDRAHNPYPNEVSHVGQDSEEEEGDNEEEGEEFVEVGEGNGEREGVGSAASGFPVNVLQSAAKTASSSSATIEFSVPSSALDTNNSNDNVKGKRKAGVKISAEQREFRRDLLRNAWSEDDELQAMVLSSIPSKFLESPPLTSSSLYTEFINDWTFWWHSSFKTAYDQLEGDFDHLISKFTHGVGTTSFGSIDCFLKRFQEYYTQCSQSRDPSSAESMDPSPLTITPEMSAVAFVAGSRALGLETRLVASLHPIPLSFSQKGKKSSNTKSKPKSSSSTSSSSSSSSSLATSPAPASSHTSASSSSILIPIASSLSSSSHVALGPYPLVFWAEIYSPIENRWIPVCPVRNLIDNISAMEPKPGVMIQLQYSYIIAFTSHFAIKDVTTRYSTTFSATVAKNRLASTGYRRDDIKCWDTLLWLFSSSSSKTDQEREEDEELQGRVVKESMPSTFAGFNNHPLFALERHLKKFELIHPNDKDSAVGVFKKELVFPRKNVHTLQNRMTWLKNHSRVPRQGETPLKFVNARVTTIARKRRVEAQTAASVALTEGGGGGETAVESLGDDADASKTGLFAEWQTERYNPPPVVNGKIPKNSFGNYELFQPQMIPKGCSHLRLPGIGQVAKRLGIDFSVAVIGFEFHGGRTVPKLDGIIVETEFVETLRMAFDETAVHAEEKEQKVREKRALNHWKMLVLKKQSMDRLNREYNSEGSSLSSRQTSARKRLVILIQELLDKELAAAAEDSDAILISDDDVDESDLEQNNGHRNSSSSSSSLTKANLLPLKRAAVQDDNNNIDDDDDVFEQPRQRRRPRLIQEESEEESEDLNQINL